MNFPPKGELESLGATVKLVRAGDMECVVRAQIGRMFAYEAAEVGEDDVVMAADVDAFVTSDKVTLPLRRDRKVWLYRYELSYMTGYTFMMQGGARFNTAHFGLSLSLKWLEILF